jgi:exodeoxyribonuclease-3
MKITTWNVNGIRAALEKGLLQWVTEFSPDILCLQEVRARPEQIDKQYLQALGEFFPSSVWNPAGRAGYSGVATFHRSLPIVTNLGLGDPRFDHEGRVVHSCLDGFHLFNIYFPNGGRDHSRVPFKLDFYAALLELCNQLHTQGEKIILTGDFNTAHKEIDLRNPKENENTTGFLPEERAWIDRYLEHGFTDIFRQLYPQHIQYTWWTYRMNARQRNVGWRLDYFLITNSLVDQVDDVIIHDDVMGSDHCPVTLCLR